MSGKSELSNSWRERGCKQIFFFVVKVLSNVELRFRFSRVRNLFLLSHSYDLVNNEEFNPNNPDVPYEHDCRKFSLHDMNSSECEAEFRFRKQDLPILTGVLQIPPSFTSHQRGDSSKNQEAFLIKLELATESFIAIYWLRKCQMKKRKTWRICRSLSQLIEEIIIVPKVHSQIPNAIWLFDLKEKRNSKPNTHRINSRTANFNFSYRGHPVDDQRWAAMMNTTCTLWPAGWKVLAIRCRRVFRRCCLRFLNDHGNGKDNATNQWFDWFDVEK